MHFQILFIVILFFFFICCSILELTNSKIAAVGFTAYSVENRGYNASDVIQFQAVLTDFNGDYVTENSTFIVPYDGVYMFTTSVQSQINETMPVDIMVNNNETLSAPARSDDVAMGHSTAIVFVYCTAGSAVYVQCRNDGDFLNGANNRNSAFSGYLLRIV